MSDTDNKKPTRRFPSWLRKRVPAGGHGRAVRGILDELNLQTVCSNAHCPNQCECFSEGTATFMILGNVCSRRCTFCAVGKGEPPAVEDDEPERLAEAARRMELEHVVITSVTRDDLPDGGSTHFARTIEAVRGALPSCTIEVLVPDFLGQSDQVATVARARPDVFNHNVETVRRLYDELRPQADLDRSLEVLAMAKEHGLTTKSGLMVGCGETREEVSELLHELRRARVDIVTIGQYLAPSPKHHPVVRFVPPEEFDDYAREAKELGFRGVASAPFVRSSYRAGEVYKQG